MDVFALTDMGPKKTSDMKQAYQQSIGTGFFEEDMRNFLGTNLEHFNMYRYTLNEESDLP